MDIQIGPWVGGGLGARKQMGVCERLLVDQVWLRNVFALPVPIDADLWMLAPDAGLLTDWSLAMKACPAKG